MTSQVDPNTIFLKQVNLLAAWNIKKKSITIQNVGFHYYTDEWVVIFLIEYVLLLNKYSGGYVQTNFEVINFVRKSPPV